MQNAHDVDLGAMPANDPLLQIGFSGIAHWEEKLLRSMLRMLEGQTRHRWAAGFSANPTIEITDAAGENGGSGLATARPEGGPLIVSYGKQIPAQMDGFFLQAPARLNALKALLDDIGDQLAIQPETTPADELIALLQKLADYPTTKVFQLELDGHAFAIVDFRRWLWMFVAGAPSVETMLLLGGRFSAKAQNGAETLEWTDAHPLSTLLLKISEQISVAKLLPALDTSKMLRLKRWMDMPQDGVMRGLIPLAAILTQRSMSYQQLQNQSKVVPRYLTAWLNVCLICGCLEQEDRPDSLIPTARPSAISAPLGFLNRLRKHLGLA